MWLALDQGKHCLIIGWLPVSSRRHRNRRTTKTAGSGRRSSLHALSALGSTAVAGWQLPLLLASCLQRQDLQRGDNMLS